MSCVREGGRERDGGRERGRESHTSCVMVEIEQNSNIGGQGRGGKGRGG